VMVDVGSLAASLAGSVGSDCSAGLKVGSHLVLCATFYYMNWVYSHSYSTVKHWR